MGDLWIQVLTRSEPDLVTLTREFRRKVAAEDVIGYETELERHPSDSGLHDDAALLYLELGRPADAVEHFKRSLTLKGPSAPAHYNLGTALTVARELDDAVHEFQQSIAGSAADVSFSLRSAFTRLRLALASRGSISTARWNATRASNACPPAASAMPRFVAAPTSVNARARWAR